MPSTRPPRASSPPPPAASPGRPTTPPSPSPPGGAATARTTARWLATSVGFPLGGLAAVVAVGPVAGPGSALAGGLVTGAVLGAVQAWGLRADRRLLAAWTGATALGLGVGLTGGSWLVGFATDLASLALQGAVTGAAVGVAQAVVLRRRPSPMTRSTTRSALWPALWPVYLAGAWTVGWLVTTGVGVQVQQQFTVFGATGALTVTAMTVFLPMRAGVVTRTTR